MKIYFEASITGKKHYKENYEKIVQTLESLGHSVISDHILKCEQNNLLNESQEEREKHHKKLNKWLSQADVVVAEVSFPSVSVGYELALALQKGKPVLALHVEDRIPVALIGEPSDKFILSPYNLPDLKKNLKMLVNDLVDQMDTRFNFFISPKHQNYLDWIAKNKKIPRSVFLRDLIEKEMQENKEYQDNE